MAYKDNNVECAPHIPAYGIRVLSLGERVWCKENCFETFKQFINTVEMAKHHPTIVITTERNNMINGQNDNVDWCAETAPNGMLLDIT